MRGRAWRRSVAVVATAAALAAGCRPDGPTPEPTATWIAAPWTAVPATSAAAAAATTSAPAATAGVDDAAAGPAVDVAALATEVSATLAALGMRATAPPPAPPPVAVHTAVPLAGCDVPRQPPALAVALADGAPTAVAAWWAGDPRLPRAFDAEVLASDDGGRSVRLRGTHDGAAFEATVRGDVALPLAPGMRVRLVWHDERPVLPPRGDGAGYALFVADDRGPVALVVAAATAPAAAARLLAGERAGLTIEPLRSPCRDGVAACGVTLHAAPVAFARGGASTTLAPGARGSLAAPDGSWTYDIELRTSHAVAPGDGAPCADPTTWRLSYAVVRR